MYKYGLGISIFADALNTNTVYNERRKSRADFVQKVSRSRRPSGLYHLKC